MDNLILLSWLAYALSSAAIVIATWKLLPWLPFSLRAGILLSQLAFLTIPASLSNSSLSGTSAKAPAFIILVIDTLAKTPWQQLLNTALPLLLALALAWPLAFIWSWLRNIWLKNKQPPAEQQQPAATTSSHPRVEH